MMTHGKTLIKTPCVPFYDKFIKEMFSIIRNANITGNNIISGNILGLLISFFSSIIGVYVLTRKALSVGLCTTLTHGELYLWLVPLVQETFFSFWVISSHWCAIDHVSCIVWPLIIFHTDRDLPADCDGHLKFISVPKAAAFPVPVPSLVVASTGNYKTDLYC